MRLNNCNTLYRVFAIGLMATGWSFAGDIVATYEPALTQAVTPAMLCSPGTAGTSDCVIGTEFFDSRAAGGFQTDFGTSGEITGTYGGNYFIQTANDYGGAGGTGRYIDVHPGNSYTLSLSTSGVPGVNYFGLWFSALDSGNLLKFYEGGINGTLIYTFGPAEFIALVGKCTAANTFCGNPNNRNLDAGEQFAFLNFFDTAPGGYFDTVVFTQSAGGDFESDNHTVAYMDPPTPSGTEIGGVPEPGSLGLLVAGGALIALRLRCRRGASA